MNPQKGEEALNILKNRQGKLSLVTLANNKIARVMNIAWGKDMGAEYSHVTTNISPSIDEMVSDFFLISDVKNIQDENEKFLLQV